MCTSCFNIQDTCTLSTEYSCFLYHVNNRSFISMCRSTVMCSWGTPSFKINEILLQLLAHTWYTLTTVSPSGSLWCWGCRLSGVGGGGWCSSESLWSVCMTRDTREMIGAGALVVGCWDLSRCLRCTGASLYCGWLPTYFFWCDLGVHRGLTLYIILIKFTSACSCNCHIEIAIRTFNDSLTLLPF